jgi:hypothetical protein
MIKDTIVGDMIFVEQTTYYSYRNKEDRSEDKKIAVTSSKETFNKWIENAKKNPDTIPTPLGLLK